MVPPSPPGPSLRQRRADDYLDKLRKVGDRTASLRTLITEIVQEGGASLSYEGGTGKKRDGLRMPTAPTWNLIGERGGYEVGKIGAEYAASLFRVPVDLAALERAGTEHYENLKAYLVEFSYAGGRVHLKTFKELPHAAS